MSVYRTIYLSIYLSSYLSIELSINLYICKVMIYSSVHFNLDNWIDNGIIEMLFDHD